jgi:excisionase family DNA binding protein
VSPVPSVPPVARVSLVSRSIVGHRPSKAMDGTNSPEGMREAIENDLAEIGRLSERVRDRLAALAIPEQAPAPEAEPDLFTLAEVAGKLRVSESFVKKLTGSGELATEKFGRRVLVPAEALDAYRAARRKAA